MSSSSFEGAERSTQAAAWGSSPDPAMWQLWQWVEAGVAVPEAFDAAALEVRGGRLKRSLRATAERLRRGQSAGAGTSGAVASSGAVAKDEWFLATVAAGSEGVVGSFGAYLAVRESIREMRRQIARVLLASIALALAAVFVGFFLLVFPRAQLQEVLEEFDLQIPGGIWVAEVLCVVLLLATVGACLALAGVAVTRRWPGIGNVSEAVWQRVPLLGRSSALIDLAELSDAMARMLAAECGYPQAMAAVQPVTASVRLRRWLQGAQLSLAQGASMDQVLSRLPLPAGLLRGLVSSSGPASDRPVLAWRIAADALLRDAKRQTSRIAFLVPPFAAIFAAGLAWGVLTLVLSRLTVLVQLISGLA